MKSAVFYGKQNLKIVEKDIPKISDDEVLLKVHACGICGTDLHIFNGDEGAAKTPSGTVLGHEFSGEVVSVGKNVTSVKAGDRVCVDPNKLCGKCLFCRDGIGHFCTDMIGIGTTVDGGFEEYCAVPASQVYKFSDSISYEEAAMTEPVSCCLHGIDLCDIKIGSTVAVIGCGMIGLIMMQLAKLSGASKIIAIEISDVKRNKALELGADLAINPADAVTTVLNENGIEQIDTVIECVGKPETIEQAISIAGKYSTVMMFGLTAPNEKIEVKPFEIFKKEITLKASFINPYTFNRALSLIESGKIDVSSMVYAKKQVSELPNVLKNNDTFKMGKIIITFD